jgi:hypothetical protein
MRKPLTDSLCAELAKDFKPFKVRRNPLKPQNGFKTSTTYRVTELRKNALNLWVIRFAKSKNEWLAQNFDMIVETKAEPKRMVKGISSSGLSIEGEFYQVDENDFTWIKWNGSIVKLVAIESDPIQVKAQEIDDKLSKLERDNSEAVKAVNNWLFDLMPDEPKPDNDTIKQLVQYVSEHRDSMTKESLMHFANLIGLIKLGAL